MNIQNSNAKAVDLFATAAFTLIVYFISYPSISKTFRLDMYVESLIVWSS